jgi:hypothetical protein
LPSFSRLLLLTSPVYYISSIKAASLSPEGSSDFTEEERFLTTSKDLLNFFIAFSWCPR